MRKIFDNKILLRVVLLIYILLLFTIVILKFYAGFNLISVREHILQGRTAGYWNINLIPFKTLKQETRSGILNLNMLGNTLPFLLLGFLLSMAEKHYRILKSLIFCILLILFFEVFQFVTCIGFFDIDDIILNSLFCFIGIIIFHYFKKLFFK